MTPLREAERFLRRINVAAEADALALAERLREKGYEVNVEAHSWVVATDASARVLFHLGEEA